MTCVGDKKTGIRYVLGGKGLNDRFFQAAQALAGLGRNRYNLAFAVRCLNLVVEIGDCAQSL